jgi:hypothetical protein
VAIVGLAQEIPPVQRGLGAVVRVASSELWNGNRDFIRP